MVHDNYRGFQRARITDESDRGIFFQEREASLPPFCQTFADTPTRNLHKSNAPKGKRNSLKTLLF